MVLRQHHAVSPVAALLCWVPFTIAMTAVILGLAVASRGLWDPLEGRALGRSVTYGLPAFEVGRVWTLATSALFTLQPLQYIPILLGFLVLAASRSTSWVPGRPPSGSSRATCSRWSETAVLLMLVRNHGYQWATDLARAADAGPRGRLPRRSRRGVGGAPAAMARTYACRARDVRLPLGDPSRRAAQLLRGGAEVGQHAIGPFCKLPGASGSRPAEATDRASGVGSIRHSERHHKMVWWGLTSTHHRPSSVASTCISPYSHPHEYALIFGSPIPSYAAPPGTIASASRVPMLLGDLLGDLTTQPFGDAGATGASGTCPTCDRPGATDDAGWGPVRLDRARAPGLDLPLRRGVVLGLRSSAHRHPRSRGVLRRGGPPAGSHAGPEAGISARRSRLRSVELRVNARTDQGNIRAGERVVGRVRRLGFSSR